MAGLALAALLAVTLAPPTQADSSTARTDATATAAGQDVATWALPGFDPGNTGFNPQEAVVTAARVPALRLRWSLTSPALPESCTRQTPPISDGRRLFLTEEDGIAAVDARTGRRLWRHAFASGLDYDTPTLALSAGTLLVATQGDCGDVSDASGTLIALNARTGVRRWSVDQTSPMSSIVVDRGVVVVAGGDAEADVVTAYRLSDHRRLWSREWSKLGAGASAGGRLLLTRTEGGNSATAVSITTGRVLWRTRQAWSAVAADPAGRVFYANHPSGALLSVNAATGRVNWRVAASAGRVATDGARVYITRNRTITARSAGTGRLIWRTTVAATANRPVVAGGVVYATVAGNRPLAILSARTGVRLATGARYAGSIGHPVVLNGRLHVTNGRTLRTYIP